MPTQRLARTGVPPSIPSSRLGSRPIGCFLMAAVALGIHTGAFASQDAAELRPALRVRGAVDACGERIPVSAALAALSRQRFLIDATASEPRIVRRNHGYDIVADESIATAPSLVFDRKWPNAYGRFTLGGTNHERERRDASTGSPTAATVGAQRRPITGRVFFGPDEVLRIPVPVATWTPPLDRLELQPDSDSPMLQGQREDLIREMIGPYRPWENPRRPRDD